MMFVVIICDRYILYHSYSFPQDCKIRVEMKATNDPKGKPNVITGKLLSKGFLAVKLKPTKNHKDPSAKAKVIGRK
jgi:hypothetical protein